MLPGCDSLLTGEELYTENALVKRRPFFRARLLVRRTAAYRVIVLGSFISLSPTYVTFAQVRDAALPTAHLTIAQPRDSSRDIRPTPHKFFDATNIALTLAESGALFADGVYTRRLVTRYPGLGSEADPIARPFVNAGWPGQIAGGVLVVGADVALRYVLHRRGHHTLERWVPLVLIVYGTAGAIHNARVLRDIERGR